MSVITLGEDEDFYRNVAHKALVKKYGKEKADKLIDSDDEDEGTTSGLIEDE